MVPAVQLVLVAALTLGTGTAAAVDAGNASAAPELAALTKVVTENLPDSWELADPAALAVFGGKLGPGSAVAFAPRADAGQSGVALVLRVPLQTVTEESFLEEFQKLDADTFCNEDRPPGVVARGRYAEHRKAYGCIAEHADGGAESVDSFQVWAHHRGRVLMFDCVTTGPHRSEALRTCGEAVEDIVAELNPTPREVRGRQLLEEIEASERAALAAFKKKYAGRTKASTWTKTGWRATRWGMGHLDGINALGLAEKNVQLHAYEEEPEVLYVNLPDETLLGASVLPELRFQRGRLSHVKIRTSGHKPKSDAFCREWADATIALLDEKYGESTCVWPDETREVCHWNKSRRHFVVLKISFKPQPGQKDDHCSAEVAYADPVALDKAVEKMLRDAEKDRKADLEKF